MNEEESKHIGDMGERAFANLCNKLDCEYLHITQDKEGFSSKMWLTEQKRPDFLINITDLAPLFIDVKVRKKIFAGTSEILSKVFAYTENYDGFQRMKNFEDSTGISTWYAFFDTNEVVNQTLEPTVYLVPLSRVEKNIPRHIKKKSFEGEPTDNWKIRIPIACMNDWSSKIDLSDRCRGCTRKYCEIDSK